MNDFLNAINVYTAQEYADLIRSGDRVRHDFSKRVTIPLTAVGAVYTIAWLRRLQVALKAKKITTLSTTVKNALTAVSNSLSFFKTASKGKVLSISGLTIAIVIDVAIECLVELYQASILTGLENNIFHFSSDFCRDLIAVDPSFSVHMENAASVISNRVDKACAAGYKFQKLKRDGLSTSDYLEYLSTQDESLIRLLALECTGSSAAFKDGNFDVTHKDAFKVPTPIAPSSDSTAFLLALMGLTGEVIYWTKLEKVNNEYLYIDQHGFFKSTDPLDQNFLVLTSDILSYFAYQENDFLNSAEPRLSTIVRGDTIFEPWLGIGVLRSELQLLLMTFGFVPGILSEDMRTIFALNARSLCQVQIENSGLQIWNPGSWVSQGTMDAVDRAKVGIQVYEISSSNLVRRRCPLHQSDKGYWFDTSNDIFKMCYGKGGLYDK